MDSFKHNIETLGVCSYREFIVKPFCKDYFRPGCDTLHTGRVFGNFYEAATSIFRVEVPKVSLGVTVESVT